MPSSPSSATLSATSVDILNAIRNSATANYRNYVPAATPDEASIKAIGSIIMDYPVLQNEFLNALVNRIGRVILSNKMFENPWAMFKKGMLEYGETIEEIFVNIAKPFKYDVAVAESEVFKREIPDVRAAFHILNYKKFYKATIQNEELRLAFLSWNGITDLIAKITDSMYTGAAYDEFLTMKYLLARHILNGELLALQIPTVQASNMKAIAGVIKGVSNKITFPATKYNLTGVTTQTKKDDQFFITTADFDATMDVEVLASAFNMSKAEFLGHRVMIDGFGSLDTARLNELFGDDDNYTAITAEELAALEAIPAVLVDREYFMIFDNLYNFTEQYNAQGLYWNYFYHTWKTFSVSPFANAAVFVPGAPAISSVEVSPATATVSAGQSVLLSAEVTTANFAAKSVTWSLTAVDGENTALDTVPATITPLGVLTVDADADSGTVITAKATSTVDSSKYDTAAITVA